MALKIEKLKELIEVLCLVNLKTYGDNYLAKQLGKKPRTIVGGFGGSPYCNVV